MRIKNKWWNCTLVMSSCHRETNIHLILTNHRFPSFMTLGVHVHILERDARDILNCSTDVSVHIRTCRNCQNKKCDSAMRGIPVAASIVFWYDTLHGIKQCSFVFVTLPQFLWFEAIVFLWREQRDQTFQQTLGAEDLLDFAVTISIHLFTSGFDLCVQPVKYLLSTMWPESDRQNR